MDDDVNLSNLVIFHGFDQLWLNGLHRVLYHGLVDLQTVRQRFVTLEWKSNNIRVLILSELF